MAKKSTSARQANTGRRSQTTAKPQAVTFMKTPGAAGTATAEAPVPAAREATLVAPSPAEAPRESRPQRAATTPTRTASPPSATPKAAAPTAPPAPRLQQPKSQAARIARAKATQRARLANLISPEHYTYVRNDVRLTAILAASMFAVMVILRIVIG